MGDEVEQTKRIFRGTPLEQQLDSDFAFALALQQHEQEQEGVSTMLPIVESDNDENRSAGSVDEDEDDYDTSFFQSQEMEAELGFSDGENSNDNQEMEEDEIDPDELSYEELIALGEIVGEESRGLSAEEISSCLSPYTRHRSVDAKTISDRCVICQAEYDDDGETLVALPCQHSYHSDCISNWLQIKKICPICGTEVSSSNVAANAI